MKQQIKAVGAKIKPFNSQINQYQQKSTFSKIKEIFFKD